MSNSAVWPLCVYFLSQDICTAQHQVARRWPAVSCHVAAYRRPWRPCGAASLLQVHCWAPSHHAWSRQTGEERNIHRVTAWIIAIMRVKLLSLVLLYLPLSRLIHWWFVSKRKLVTEEASLPLKWWALHKLKYSEWVATSSACTLSSHWGQRVMYTLAVNLDSQWPNLFKCSSKLRCNNASVSSCMLDYVWELQEHI